MDLCSLFANLLDNAIQAGKQLPPDTPPFVNVKAQVAANVLALSVTNSSAPPPPPAKRASDPLPSHGLGLSIVEDIVRRYDGKLETAYNEGVFTATAYLVLPEAKPSA